MAFTAAPILPAAADGADGEALAWEGHGESTGGLETIDESTRKGWTRTLEPLADYPAIDLKGGRHDNGSER